MLRHLTRNIHCVQSVSLFLGTSCRRNHLVSIVVGAQRRWISDEVRTYKAAILEEFDKKLTVTSIKNRTKLGDGMVRPVTLKPKWLIADIDIFPVHFFLFFSCSCELVSNIAA